MHKWFDINHGGSWATPRLCRGSESCGEKPGRDHPESQAPASWMFSLLHAALHLSALSPAVSESLNSPGQQSSDAATPPGARKGRCCGASLGVQCHCRNSSFRRSSLRSLGVRMGALRPPGRWPPSLGPRSGSLTHIPSDSPPGPLPGSPPQGLSHP